MKFCKTIPEFVDQIMLYQIIHGHKPLLQEKDRCVVASHAPETKIIGDVFALSFKSIQPDAMKKGYDIAKWN